MIDCIRCNNTRQIAITPQRSMQCTNCIGTHKYAGIGSRQTPKEFGPIMRGAAMQLAVQGWILRSGEAKQKPGSDPNTCSADLEFEAGCNLINPRAKVIRIPTESQAALDHAAQFHPNWSACSDYAKALHARNSLIMLGDWLDDPVKFVLCWTSQGAVTGGTGQALRIAAAYGIPVFNLAVQPIESLWSWLRG